MGKFVDDISRLNWFDWVKGIIAAFISGGASALTSTGVVAWQDPQHYAGNTGAALELFWSVFIVSGLITLAAYLKQKPVPDLVQLTTTTETTKQTSNATVVTTVEAKQIVPAEETPKP